MLIGYVYEEQLKHTVILNLFQALNKSQRCWNKFSMTGEFFINVFISIKTGLMGKKSYLFNPQIGVFQYPSAVFFFSPFQLKCQKILARQALFFFFFNTIKAFFYFLFNSSWESLFMSGKWQELFLTEILWASIKSPIFMYFIWKMCKILCRI